jgi:hypothetical protein
MPATYEKIATTTLGSAAATITLSSIPATYTDLTLVLIGTTSNTNYIRLQFNSDTATNYSYTILSGNGTTATSTRNSTQSSILCNNSGSTSTTVPTLTNFNVFSYAGATNKTVLVTRSGDLNGSGAQENIVGLWRSTSAITSITILLNGAGDYSIGTTATLYGILKA